MKNTFWVGANILFDLETGKTTRVLQLVFRQEDATLFNEDDANNYYTFVTRRTTQDKIVWSIERSLVRHGFFAIRGEQSV